MTQPASVPTNGTILAIFVEAIADPAAPAIGEVTDPTSLDVTCYLTGDGLNTATTENSIEDPRACSRQTYESPGDFTDTLEFTYVFNPASPADDEAHLALPQGTTGFIVIRWAVDSEQAVAIGDIVDVYPVTAGVQRKQPITRNAVHRIMQKMFVTGEVQRDVEIVA